MAGNRLCRPPPGPALRTQQQNALAAGHAPLKTPRVNIHVDIGHPGHVHFFRHAVVAWQEQGHAVYITCRRIAVVERLLDARGLPYDVVSTRRSGSVGLGVELVEHAFRLYPALRRRRTAVSVSVGGAFTVHAARLAGARAVVFYDTETARVANRLAFPFATSIVTPDVYPHDLGKKHLRYRGFQELAYLHPDRFTPDPGVPAKYGLAEEPYGIVRFGAWKASHDIGVASASPGEKRALVDAVKAKGRVVIVPEADVAEELREYVMPIDPADFHDLLAGSRCCVTEGATTATEACLLGVPTLYFNPIRPCYIPVLEQYGLLRAVLPGDDMLRALEDQGHRFPDRASARTVRDRIVSDHEDVTRVILSVVNASGTTLE